MNFHVTNCGLNVGSIRIIGVGSSSLVLVGDSECISLVSAFDTPPESLQTGPAITPLAGEAPAEEEMEGAML